MARNDPHTQLTNSQKQILEDLYDAAGVTSVDQLPYTDAIDRITAEFNGPPDARLVRWEKEIHA